VEGGLVVGLGGGGGGFVALGLEMCGWLVLGACLFYLFSSLSSLSLFEIGKPVMFAIGVVNLELSSLIDSNLVDNNDV